MTNIRPRLLDISKKYILKNYPDSTNVFEFNALIEDNTTRWKITYELPELWLGGVPVIFISKDTFQVIEAYHTQ